MNEERENNTWVTTTKLYLNEIKETRGKENKISILNRLFEYTASCDYDWTQHEEFAEKVKYKYMEIKDFLSSDISSKIKERANITNDDIIQYEKRQEDQNALFHEKDTNQRYASERKYNYKSKYHYKSKLYIDNIKYTSNIYIENNAINIQWGKNTLYLDSDNLKEIKNISYNDELYTIFIDYNGLCRTKKTRLVNNCPELYSHHIKISIELVLDKQLYHIFQDIFAKWQLEK